MQARLISHHTEQFLRDAGIEPGMRVLDIGSGAGDVSRLVARLVGPSGSVLGVDIDGPSVDTARQISEAAGVTNVEFTVSDLGTIELEPSSFDAVVGRMVLMHVPDAVAVLRRVAASVGVGGLVAFQEAHLRSPWLAFPESPESELVQRLRGRALNEGQPVHPDMGLALRGAFQQAGLDVPKLRTDGVILRADEPEEYELVEQTVRSLLPGWRRLGISESDKLEPDGLAAKLRDQTGEHGAIMLYPLVGAWSRIRR